MERNICRPNGDFEMLGRLGSEFNNYLKKVEKIGGIKNPKSFIFCVTLTTPDRFHRRISLL